MSTLSPEAMQLLRELRGSPAWKEVLEVIRTASPLPRYKVKTSETKFDPAAQERNWIFISGQAKQSDRIVHFLETGEINVKRNHE